MIQVCELYTFPVKSLAGIKLTHTKLSKFGLQFDRRWMIVDVKGKFISQREIPQMVTIKTAIENEQLILSHENSNICIPSITSTNKKIVVTVWQDTCNAIHVCRKVDQWLSKILKVQCQLVYMPDNAQRQIDINYAAVNQYVSFADAFPILIISQASLDDLNSRLETPVNISRFRANIIVSGTAAFAEDDWHDISINGIEFKAVKKCSRCIMPSINQQTGIKDKTTMLAVFKHL